jgi:photosystem II stability/assembly factor-like uncharacterized protein
MCLVKFAPALFAFTCIVLAQSPFHLDYACPPEDIDSFGLSCSPEEPCAVFLELSAIESAGDRLFVAGNLHTERTTLYGVLLASDDGGKTWTEPLKRLRAASLEQIQFADPSTGWISGQAIEPLPRDPFLLITTDGGKSWRQRAIFEESQFGSIGQFWFDSKTTGRMQLDHSGRHDVYETNTGGENWEMKESSSRPVVFKGRTEDTTLRLRPDGKLYHVERRGGSSWSPVASFIIHVADCK